MSRINWANNKVREIMARERSAALEDMYWRADWDQWKQANPQGRLASIRCLSCGHRGNARVPKYVMKEPHFRCGKCGSGKVRWRV